MTKTELDQEYAYGFESDIDQEILPPGLSEDVITTISRKKQEPLWLLNWRLKAFAHWKTRPEPHWSTISYPPIDYQAISYFAAPKKPTITSLDEIDPEILATFQKLGIPLEEQKQLAGVAVDAVIDSVSVKTTFQETLQKAGVIFCPISEAIQKYPDLVKRYLGSVVGPNDNFFAALNSAVFSDGTFVYIPKNTTCPMELSSYFRINARNTGQFERTLIIADHGSTVSYLEGCSAPQRDERQLHGAVVELIALEGAKIKYSTVQNWYPGNKDGEGGIYNFVTKRGLCAGDRSQISWTQIETGSRATWKYPSVVLKGKHSVGEFYSITVTNNHQQADTGTKMIHMGSHSKSRIVSKGISLRQSTNTFRSLVKVTSKAEQCHNLTRCDSLILSSDSQAITLPTVELNNAWNQIEHEAVTSKLSLETLQYLQARGLSAEQAENLIIHGFCKEIIQKLPLEFAIEAKKLLEISMEGAVG